MSGRSITRRLALGGALAAPAAFAQGTDWPNRPVRFVVPYPPGGPTDILNRVHFGRHGFRGPGYPSMVGDERSSIYP